MCYNVEVRNTVTAFPLLGIKKLAIRVSVLLAAIVAMALDGDYDFPSGLFRPKALI